MKLLVPTQYRLKPAHDAWLQARADKQGHGNKALTLRILLDREMVKTAKSNGRKTRRA